MKNRTPLLLVAGTIASAPLPLSAQVELNLISRYAQTSPFDPEEGAVSEIVAHDPGTKRLFVTDDLHRELDIVDFEHLPGLGDAPGTGFIGSVDLSAYGSPNGVAAANGLVAVAVQANPKTAPGKIVFIDPATGDILAEVTVGALPDAVTFTPDGSKLLVANEGEPNDDYDVDPVGSVSIVAIPTDITEINQSHVATADFTAFNGQEDTLRKQGIRIFGPNASAAQDIEPEYIAVSPDGSTAFVTLQENNAVAVIDIASATVTSLQPLGYKNHQIPFNALDPSNRDAGISINPWPVLGMYQPDAIAAYTVNGKTYYLTANEGDARDYDGFTEDVRVGDFDGTADEFGDDVARRIGTNLLSQVPDLLANENLGRLKTTTAAPGGIKAEKDGSLTYRQIYAYGARSFSIWDARNGRQVYDSADDFEQITAAMLPDIFNTTNDETDFDDRSDDKGPEPEAITLGVVDGRTYAFIGLERVGGVMTYDVTNPKKPAFVHYVNNRLSPDAIDNLGDDYELILDDLGPECTLFIPAATSPTDAPLVVVSNEVSGSVLVYEVVPSAP